VLSLAGPIPRLPEERSQLIEDKVREFINVLLYFTKTHPMFDILCTDAGGGGGAVGVPWLSKLGGSIIQSGIKFSIEGESAYDFCY
jgi:hypothetical protein